MLIAFSSFDHLAIAALDLIDCGEHSLPKSTGMKRLPRLLSAGPPGGLASNLETKSWRARRHLA
jgi:hypothetical protein